MTDGTVALILAGGRSSRFGRDKLVEPIDGRPMLDHVVDAVRGVASTIVLVAAPDASPAVPPGIQVVHDETAFEGPLAGVAAGLGAIDVRIERVIVVGGDMPTLVPAVLQRLLDNLDTHSGAVLADDVGPRPLPLAVRRAVALEATARLLGTGERRLQALLSELDVAIIPPSTWQADDPRAATLRDVDVPGDLPT